MSALSLLDQAQAVLEGAAPSRNRMACWLVRSALEQAVRDRLTEAGRPPGGGTMRSLLTCLEVAYADQPMVVTRAQHAWVGLSNACHHHAFELSPTATDVQEFIDSVGAIAEGENAKARVTIPS